MNRNITFKMLIIVLIAFLLNIGGKCGSTNKPDPIFYRTDVRVTYTRDVNAITNPNGINNVSGWANFLEPDGAGNRFMTFIMYEISENVFSATISRIFVQTETYSIMHEIWMEDDKLVRKDSNNKNIQFSYFTGENISIPGAYDIEIVPYQAGSAGTKMLFKLR